ncbi:hypothetical protein HK414_22085 [Ramlibacter terrae]|uniref:Hydantoinase B/oxoprolinase domain-containing protein n=1 Tax=Ramlibacter terrae TaxID=2732511 RepID=A0ABX6P4T6_9BURK|nr:hypothetical protein HK414_22085 [Ramlibacter terrae]
MTEGGNIELDFEGTAPQVKSMFNSSTSSALAAAISSVRSILADKDIPANDGCLRPIHVKLPPGSILNPQAGLPVRARVIASYRLLDAVHDALAKAVPERVPAQGFNSTTGLYLTQKRPDGRIRIYADVLGGGYGAAPDYDGAHALAGILSSSRNTPIESIEQIHPQLQMLHYRLVPDSCGAGRWRGGLGFSRAIQVLEDGIELSYYSEHFRYPPRGKQGGCDAALASLVVRRGSEVFRLPNTDLMKLQRGDIVELSVGGGAGWGDPALRAADAVAGDRPTASSRRRSPRSTIRRRWRSSPHPRPNRRWPEHVGAAPPPALCFAHGVGYGLHAQGTLRPPGVSLGRRTALLAPARPGGRGGRAGDPPARPLRAVQRALAGAAAGPARHFRVQRPACVHVGPVVLARLPAAPSWNFVTVHRPAACACWTRRNRPRTSWTS